MTPYLSFLLSPLVEQLRGSDDREEGFIGPAELCVVQTLTKSMNVDEGGPYSKPSDSMQPQTSDVLFFSIRINSVLA